MTKRNNQAARDAAFKATLDALAAQEALDAQAEADAAAALAAPPTILDLVAETVDVKAVVVADVADVKAVVVADVAGDVDKIVRVHRWGARWLKILVAAYSDKKAGKLRQSFASHCLTAAGASDVASIAGQTTVRFTAVDCQRWQAMFASDQPRYAGKLASATDVAEAARLSCLAVYCADLAASLAAGQAS